MRGATTVHFSPELFDFLRALKRHNERDWFQRNKTRYEQHVRQPLLQFIVDFAPYLGGISVHFVADPRPVGGSMFRIHRDTRFARDKSPYKTAAAAQFRHAAGRDVHAPGFYLHLEPGEVFAGAGLWHPDGQALALVRQAIADDPAAWTRAVRGSFGKRCTFGGDALKRPPRGFDPQHPLIEEIKRKDFVALHPLSEDQVCAPGFVRRFARACETMAPLVAFVTRALGLPF
jgi:uncharacterized protein (TIGR02453 family)